MTTANIQDTVVDLNELVDAYAEILDNAKQQLETLTIDNDTLRKLEESVVERLNYTRITSRFIDEVHYASGSGVQLVNLIAERVADKLADTALSHARTAFCHELEDFKVAAMAVLKDSCNSRIAELMGEWIVTKEAENLQTAQTLKRMLNFAFTPDELARLIAQAYATTTNEADADA